MPSGTPLSCRPCPQHSHSVPRPLGLCLLDCVPRTVPSPGCGGVVQGNTGAVGAGAADISAGPRLCQRVGGFAVVPTNRRAKAVLQTGKGGVFFTQQILQGAQSPVLPAPQVVPAPQVAGSSCACSQGGTFGAHGSCGCHGGSSRDPLQVNPRAQEPGLCLRLEAGTAAACGEKHGSDFPGSN